MVSRISELDRWMCSNRLILNASENREGSLQSATNHVLMYPQKNMVCYGQRSFSIIGPRTWNQLPPNIRDPSLTFDLITFVEDLKLWYLTEYIMHLSWGLGCLVVIHSAADARGPGFNSLVAQAYMRNNSRASILADKQCWLCAVQLQQTAIVECSVVHTCGLVLRL